jgi:hypothetical protein
MTVTGRAVASINVGNGPGANCALALGISSDGPVDQANAITGEGNGPLNLSGCSISTNSNNAGNYSDSGTPSVRS